ncbi:MAG: hypothetical protein R3E12_11290 [Candidatus Eisenbacteria bacterium]
MTRRKDAARQDGPSVVSTVPLQLMSTGFENPAVEDAHAATRRIEDADVAHSSRTDVEADRGEGSHHRVRANPPDHPRRLRHVLIEARWRWTLQR